MNVRKVPTYNREVSRACEPFRVLDALCVSKPFLMLWLSFADMNVKNHGNSVLTDHP